MTRLPHLRKLSIIERRKSLDEHFSKPGFIPSEIYDGIDLDLADVMIESAVGFYQLPVGLVQDIKVNGELYNLPLATEEPSVIAAAQYGSSILSCGQGFSVEISESIMTAQIFFFSVNDSDVLNIKKQEQKIAVFCEPVLASMTERGGGWRGFDVQRIAEDKIKCEIHVDVCDAMGANLLNTLAEKTAVYISEICGVNKIMAILSNKGDRRLGRAEVRLPISRLRRRGIDSYELAKRLEQASEIAALDSGRAVTHNKGIMNGVSAFALATGNDTRALEAAVHAFASKSGKYCGLSTYRVDEARNELIMALEMPIPLATVGGASSYHPGAKLALDICGVKDVKELAGLAVAIGLAQNFAALSALVSEGIQEGHMGLHARRIAYAVGARGNEIVNLSAALVKAGRFNKTEAESILKKMRGVE